MKKILIIILMVLVGHHYTQAQFGKKLSQMIGGKEIPVADQYSFNTKVVYQMHTEYKGKPGSMEFTMRFPKEGAYQGNQISEVGSEKGKTKTKGTTAGIFTVIDTDHKAVIVLMDQNNIAQVVPMDEKLQKVDTPTNTPASIQKTGNTKEILGYTCYEYSMDSPQASGTFWMSTEVDINYQDFANSINQTFQSNRKNSFEIPEGGEGFMMEMSMISKGKKGGKSHMLVTEIGEEEKTFTMSDYQVMNGGMMKGLGSK